MSGDASQTTIDTGAQSSITIQGIAVSSFDGDEFIF
jgi:hypothetical protein